MGVEMENDNPRMLAARKIDGGQEAGPGEAKRSRWYEKTLQFFQKKPLAEGVAVMALSAGAILGVSSCGGPGFDVAWGPDNQDASAENESGANEGGNKDVNLESEANDSGETSLIDKNVSDVSDGPTSDSPNVDVVSDSTDAPVDIVETGIDVSPEIGPEPVLEASVDTGPDITVNDVVNDPIIEEGGQTSPWEYKVVCTITTGLSPESDLYDFPAYCTLDSASLIAANKMRSDCYDLRVQDTNHSQLSYEIEEGTCNTANTAIWLKLPLARGGQGNPVNLLYGNPAAVNGQDAPGVWSNGFVSVWHLSDTSDSLGINNLTITGTANFGSTNCKFGQCAELTPSSFLSKLSATHPTGANPSTFSCWGVTTTVNANNRIIGATGVRSANRLRDVIAVSSTDIGVFAENYGGTIKASLMGQTPGYYSTGNNFFASTYTGATYSVFLNSAHGSTTGTLSTQAGTLWIGAAGGPSTEAWAQTTHGYIDECRLSNVARSELWMKAEYSVNSTNGSEGPNN